jgi:hypothetical protein
VRQVGGIIATDAPDRDEDLMMMRIIGDPREGQPDCHVLVTEISTDDLDAGVKTMMLLRKVIQEDFPVRVLNVLGHRFSSGMLAPGKMVMCMPARGSASGAPALY